VIGTAGAINSTSKRLLTELQVPNPTGDLSAGAYVQISLDIPVAAGGVMVPARTLLFQSGQPAVAIVRPDSTIEIRKVSIIRDLGARLQVSDNLPVTDQLVINPSPALAPGTVVTVVPSTPADLSEPVSPPPNQT
jgi:membrane fusion protein, multidrug efflux system